MPRSFNSLNRSPGVNIDIIGFEREIEARGLRALDATLVFAEEKARKYAPVRSIFARTRRGPAFPTMRMKEGEHTHAEVIQAYRRHPIASGGRFKLFQKSTVPTRRIDVPKPPRIKPIPVDKYGIALDLKQAAYSNQIATSIPPRGPTYGHNNSVMPVIRSKGKTVTGDLRQYRGGHLLTVATVTQIRGGKPRFGVGTGDEFLTAKGKYEVKTGRAAFKRIGDEATRIGGALRASIVKVNATLSSREGGMFIGYVRAGGETVDYAGYQEFGTRHNRAQPFLRPALYESRLTYKRNMENALKGGRMRTR